MVNKFLDDFNDYLKIKQNKLIKKENKFMLIDITALISEDMLKKQEKI